LEKSTDQPSKRMTGGQGWDNKTVLQQKGVNALHILTQLVNPALKDEANE